MTCIAYLGSPGTYTEAAAINYVKLHKLIDAQLFPYPTIQQTLKAVITDKLNLAVVPVENSIQGGVTMTLDAIWQWDDLQIQHALVLPIQHALITTATAIDQIQTVYSHPQALAQCQQWLERHLPSAHLVATNSTNEKVQEIASDATAAVISSQRAAELFQVPVLAFPINDYPDNSTRFWIVGLTAPTTKGTHTSLAFSVKQNAPGALVKPLSFFADRHINLSRIESRPSKKSLGDYIFFADIEASVEDSKVQEAIAELAQFTETLKIFGSYDTVCV